MRYIALLAALTAVLMFGGCSREQGSRGGGGTERGTGGGGQVERDTGTSGRSATPSTGMTEDYGTRSGTRGGSPTGPTGASNGTRPMSGSSTGTL